MKKIITLYPDTGRHYYFYPVGFIDNIDNNFDDYIDSIYPENSFFFNDTNNNESEDLIGIIESNDELNNEWITSDRHKYSWIICKKEKRLVEYKNRKLEILGLYICIDTTTYRENANNCIRTSNNDDKALNIPEDEKANSDEHFFNSNSNNINIDLLDVFNISNDGNEYVKLELSININNDNNEEGVELIVDYGNSRTIVYALDTAPISNDKSYSELNRLEHFSRPILINNLNYDSSRIKYSNPLYTLRNNDIICDSWVTYAINDFVNINKNHKITQVDEVLVDNDKKSWWEFWKSKYNKTYTKKSCRSYQFFSLDVVKIGENGYDLIEKVFEDENIATHFFTNSPKRFMYLDDVNEDIILKQIEKDIINGKAIYKLCNITEELKDFIKLDPKKYNPSKAMLPAALSILDRAYYQITSEKFRSVSNPSKRIIKNVNVTFPPGWHYKEIENYTKIWEEAVDIFQKSLNHELEYIEDEKIRNKKKVNRNSIQRRGKNDIKKIEIGLNISLDEATASALPIVFSEIIHLSNDITNWVNLYGKNNNVRTLTIDIGGGTVDVSIIDFSLSSNSLQPSVIYSNSSKDAGDILIKKIIENLLFPTILNEQDDIVYNDIINNLKDNIEASGLMAIITFMVKKVLYPVIEEWFSKINVDSSDNITNSEIIETKLIDIEQITEKSIDEFNKVFFNGKKIVNTNTILRIDKQELRDIVKQWAENLIIEPSLLLEAYGCNLVIVSGKPSELYDVKKTIEKNISLPKNNIIFTKNYYAGRWLPFKAKNNKISDAKYATIAGTMILSALDNNIFKSLTQVDITKLKNDIGQKYYWEIENIQKIMSPDKDNIDITINSKQSCIVYRYLFNGANKIPFYKITNKSEDIQNIRIRRVEYKYGHITYDILEIDNSNIELKLHRLDNEEGSINDPIFNIKKRG